MKVHFQFILCKLTENQLEKKINGKDIYVSV